MPEFLRDEYLRFALYDATRGLELPGHRRKLTDEERHSVADAIYKAIKRAGWDIVCYPERASSTGVSPTKA